MSKMQDKLLDAAEVEISLRGFHAVSFRSLAEKAGIKSASVHYHFPNKEDLGLALVERYSQDFKASLEETANHSPALQALCETYRNSLHQNQRICLCAVLGAERGGLPERINEAVASFMTNNIEWVQQAINGENAASKRAKSRQFVATLQGGMMMAVAMDNLELFDDVISVLLAQHNAN